MLKPEARIPIIVLACAFALSPLRVFAQEQERAAREAIEAKRFGEARQIFLELSQRTPENLDYLVWVGRLSGWLNDYEAATRAYDGVLARQPDHFEALVGKAYLLMWQRNFQEAETLLARARQVAPESAELYLALARHAHYQAHPKEALAHVERALALEPGNKEAADLKAQIVLPRPFEIRFGYEHDRFSFAGPGNMGALSVGYVISTGHIAGHYEGWHKFDESVHRGGLSFSRRLGKGFTLLGGGMWAPGATVLAVQDYTAGFVQALPGRIAAGADYRHLRFSGARIHLVAPNIEYYFEKPIWLRAVIYNVWSDLHIVERSVFSQAYMLNYNHQLSDPVLLSLYYARGAENFASLSIDRIGSFQANTYTGALDFRLSPAYSFNVYYGFQSRSNDSHQKTFGMGLKIRK